MTTQFSTKLILEGLYDLMLGARFGLEIALYRIRETQPTMTKIGLLDVVQVPNVGGLADSIVPDPADPMPSPRCPSSPVKHSILIVDQDFAASKVLGMRLKLAGFACSSAKDSWEALEILKTAPPDCILADLRTSRLGVNLLAEVRKRHRRVALVLLAKPSEAYTALKELKEGADDCLLKPLNAKELLKNLRRVLANRRAVPFSESSSPLRSLLSRPQEAEPDRDPYESTLLALGTALDLRDSEVAGHSKRVCMYSLEIARRLHCSPADFKVLREGALLHDIGKLAIPDAILWKPGPLNPEEWTVMKTHVTIGYQLVQAVPFLQAAAELILTHHERYDGKGYPRGLTANEIPLCAKIFAVADAFDAMTTSRPYQNPISVPSAVSQIRNQSGNAFDPRVVEAFLAIPEQTVTFIRDSYNPLSSQARAHSVVAASR